MIETNDIAELKALIVSLQAEIQRLRAENEELKTRLAQNSTNSHKPPASEGYTKKPLIKPALPKVAGKKVGGQTGHPGKTLQMVEPPDAIQRYQAAHCQPCGLPLTGEGHMVARRQVFDLPKPRLYVKEHQLMAHQCRCGCVQTGQFPAGVIGPVQYGPGIQAQSILLNVDCRMPLLR